MGTRVRANPALDGQETSSHSGTIDLTGCCSHTQWPCGIMWPQLPTHQHQVTRMSDIMPLPFSFHSDYLQAIQSPLWYPDFYLIPPLGIHLLWLGDWRLEPSKQFWLSWAPTPPICQHLPSQMASLWTEVFLTLRTSWKPPITVAVISALLNFIWLRWHYSVLSSWVCFLWMDIKCSFFKLGLTLKGS